MTKTPTIAEEIIARFGGLSSLAQALTLPMSTVQGWKERGVIPFDHWAPLERLASSRGFIDVNCAYLGARHGQQRDPERRLSETCE